MNPTMDAIYLVSPLPHIVDCVLADFERRRYKKSFLVWTAVLDPQLRRRIDNSQSAQQQLAGFETLAIDYYPRESHLVTFRDPWSFPILYHPACNNLVREHMQILAQKVRGNTGAHRPYQDANWLTDRRRVHNIGRIPNRPLLPPQESDTRGECAVRTPGPVCAGRA
jgi:syntaxin-binding protein 1